MQKIILQLEQIIVEYAPQLEQLNEADFSIRPAPGKWSGKELLGHLIDSAQNNIRRFVTAQYEEMPTIIYAQDNWVAAANYQNYPGDDLIALWILLNKHACIILKNLPAGAANRQVQTQEIHTVEWLAADYNKHMLHHLHRLLHLEPVVYP